MRHVSLAVLVLAVVGCITPMTPPPQWSPVSDATEAEYMPYLNPGTAALAGQAFLTQRNGGVVKGAGRTVTLDPATSVGTQWWTKAGKIFQFRFEHPDSPGFQKARRSTVADADGKFRFANLPAGQYYVRSEVTWEVGGYMPTQGGLVGQLVEIGDGEQKDVILNDFPR